VATSESVVLQADNLTAHLPLDGPKFLDTIIARSRRPSGRSLLFREVFGDDVEVGAAADVLKANTGFVVVAVWLPMI
jgi:hypothetical protein